MNLICGIVDFSKSINVVETGNKMVEAFSGYPGDKVNCWHNDWCYVYCHHQHITPESVKDTLPFYDADSGLVITASAIVDNRKELLDLLGIKDSHLNEISDSQLILKAYKKWGEDCSKHIIGDYCFAIIDIRDKKVVCSRDHTGKICFYYTGGSSYFAFSSIIKPFFSIPGLKKSFNNQWIADFLAIPTVIHELDASLTVYRDIYEVLPAETLAVTPEKTTKTIYWNPLMLPQIKFKKDEEYDEAFREIFFEAVRCRTRSIGNVGIMLSGGLDSGSVASVAAMQMEAEGRRLKAYSAVPFDGYREHLGDGFISDESNYINEIAGKYSNIDIAYNKAEGKNSFTDIRQFIDIIEQPYKTVENFYWIYSLLQQAACDNCKVILTGQYGNNTISFGSFLIHAYTLLREFNFISLIKEIDCYCRLKKYSRKKFAEHFIKWILPIKVKKHILKLTEKDYYRYSCKLISEDLYKKYNEGKRLKKAGYDISVYGSKTIRDFRKMMISETTFTQVATIETKLAARKGVLFRDPTKDKRVVDFCFSIPSEQYVKNGVERVLVRRALKGILPEKVRMNQSVKGIQSADWIQRLDKNWPEIHGQMTARLSDCRLMHYLNVDGIRGLLNKHRKLSDDDFNNVDIRMLFIYLIFSEFMYCEKDETGGDSG